MRIPRVAPAILLASSLLLAGCGDSTSPPGEIVGPGVPPAADSVDISWLRQAAVPLRGSDPAGALDDLAPLRAMVGDARIVGLGEATHGTREFFRMKHRVLRYLVEEMGFSTFAIEATYAEANRLNDYVLNGVGDPEVLLSNLYFWTWNTAEVLEMIRWMRAHNQAPGNAPRVSFYGFDMGFQRVAVGDVDTYLGSVSAVARDSAASWYNCYRPYQDTPGITPPNYQLAPEEMRTQCRASIARVHQMMHDSADVFAARSGRRPYELALRAARVVQQNEMVRGAPRPGDRDEYMAENVAWVAEVAEPGSRVVVWAHNGHVWRMPRFMGQHLEQRYGSAYRPVGLSFHAGSVMAVRAANPPLGPVVAPPAGPQSYEHQFRRLGQAQFLVDLRPLRDAAPAGAEWLRGPRPFRMIGATYDAADETPYYFSVQLPALFDLVIHVDQSTPSQPLPFRYR
jgi:erythromycin esterase